MLGQAGGEVLAKAAKKIATPVQGIANPGRCDGASLPLARAIAGLHRCRKLGIGDAGTVSCHKRGSQMKKTYATALSLAALVCAWVYGPASAQASSQNVTPGDNPTLVPTAADIASGKLIQSPAGRGIGSVDGVVPDPASGRPAYVLVGTPSGTTAIPYWAIIHLLRDAHLVIDRSTLASAPRVNDDQIRNSSNDAWKQRADTYWQAYR